MNPYLCAQLVCSVRRISKKSEIIMRYRFLQYYSIVMVLRHFSLMIFLYIMLEKKSLRIWSLWQNESLKRSDTIQKLSSKNIQGVSSSKKPEVSVPKRKISIWRKSLPDSQTHSVYHLSSDSRVNNDYKKRVSSSVEQNDDRRISPYQKKIPKEKMSVGRCTMRCLI